ncbi:MAG: tRNA preQ1(34) S-adenosylmethionine ribosyltransferase-isomerase QueA [Actinobacteria bacterium]|nr:tRNA preQ1(34) S-adenosylmethionine ribosyltransferase-isomerase QueA [Actinomycetota bacterium]
MQTAAFDYDLPAPRIAQRPVEPRDAARLLVDRGDGRAPQHRTVADLPDLLAPGDLLVLNQTRVLPARLSLRKATGGRAEVLLLEPAGHDRDHEWRALVRPGRRLPTGTVLYPPDTTAPAVKVGEPCPDDGSVRAVTLLPREDEDDHQLMARLGTVPLPPYITQPLRDAERYQTIYANTPGSVAAPTAGLHLTHAVLDRCRQRGIDTAFVELVVGLGTFRPISTENVADHRMHRELYHVPAETLRACEQAERVVAVGTTTVRALESAAATGENAGRTELFIHRPYEFRVVDVVLTNFHQPRSSLLVMIDALVGPRWRDLYAVALRDGYRFLSFGDAMLVSTGGDGRERRERNAP